MHGIRPRCCSHRTSCSPCDYTECYKTVEVLFKTLVYIPLFSGPRSRIAVLYLGITDNITRFYLCNGDKAWKEKQLPFIHV